ncbi:hypothetical protein D0Z00_000309 [Geotrichum galactomycetum]|uniref:Uncharacterized protein n=1 Tax=Geotrichum galactomycetum TaxID=27317 RepID=A0ACB6VA46_9ASCO|nr:hypothetical protein D0Z00_000309 [Geotrichum candidum]
MTSSSPPIPTESVPTVHETFPNKEETHLDHTRHNYKFSTHGVTRIFTTDSHVHIGEQSFERQEFNRAFEGYLNPGYSPAPSRKFANPVPVGVAGFSLTLFVLSLLNLGARGGPNPAALAGLMWFYAGAIELLSGMWCIVIEATWAGTLLSSFGGFWIGYGCIVVDVFGLAEAYDGYDLTQLLGMWILAWAIFSTMMWAMTFKSTWPLFILMGAVVFCLLTLSIAQFVSVNHATAAKGLTRAGGVFGIIASVMGWYVTYEGICSKENAYWVPPVLLMPGAVTSLED